VTLDRLQAHYGFTRTPFGKALAPSMLHRHTAHAEAVARIGWCITERALGVVTGEVGAGKTVAVRAALANLDPSRHTTIYLGNPAVGGRGLYGGIVTALGGEPRFHKAALIPQTVELLAAEEHERGRTVVLILDEAHLLTSDQLEELRLLTNADMDSHSPFACLLIGQPTLRRRIKLGTFAALDQRIALRYTLTAMSDTEAAAWAGTSACRAPAGAGWACGLSTGPPRAPRFSTGPFSTRSFPRRVAPWLQPAGMAGGWNPFRRFSCAIGQLTH
jgi:type II secretory pathway predicted ATPase ExeA